MRIDDLVRELAEGSGAIEAPLALVVAHPDDETIGMGAQLARCRNLTIVHVTDGAPRDLADAHHAGFESAAQYAAARRDELHRALALGEASPVLVELSWPDRCTYEDLPGLTREMRDRLGAIAPAAVLTHPFEGGHPDHDAVAFAVHLAAIAPVAEIALYHRAGDGLATNEFLPGDAGRVRRLDDGERARKRWMMDAFTTQRETLLPFGVEREAFRTAPRYDFTAPPHAGPLWYERYGWGITGESWCERAAVALRALR